MAANSAMFPEEATIIIAASGAVSSTGIAVTAEVTNFTESGGEEDIESVPVFGGGNIDRMKPRTQIEVSFDVVLRYNTASTMLKWDEYVMGAIASSTVSSSTSAATKAIYIQFTDGTYYYTRAYNNAKGITFEPDVAADDMATGTITFKLSPTTAAGGANKIVKAAAASTIASWQS
jgi:acetylglutamate kinase